MKNTQIKTKILVGLTIPILMLVLVAVGVYYYTNKVITSFEQVTHTSEVIADVNELIKNLVDMETGKRGFLLSGEEKFLEPYNSGKLNFNILMSELKIKVNDNPVQQSNLEQLEDLKSKWDNEINRPEITWRQEINEGKSSLDSLIVHFNKAVGKEKMDIMRLKVDEILSIEKNLNIIRANNAKKASSFLISFTLIATLIALIVSISIGLLKAEQKVRKNQKLLSSIINNSNSLIYLKDLEGKFTMVNKLFEEQFLPENEVLGKTDHDFMPKEDADRYRKNDLQIIQTGLPMQFEESVPQADGIHTMLSNKFPLYDERNKLIGVCGISTDISDRKKAVQELKESEAKHSAMIANISDVICIIGADNLVKYSSPNMEKWFGWQPQDFIGKEASVKVHPDDFERIQGEYFALLEKENAVITVEYRYLCKDNSYKCIKLTAANLITDPIINGVLVNFHDINQRKQAEIQIQQQNEELLKLNADKDRFLQILAHDLKSPFNSLLGFSDLLLRNLHRYDIDKIEKQINIIHQTSHHTYNLLEDLLLWSNSQSKSSKMLVERQEIDLKKTCGEIIDNVKHQADTKEISINCYAPEKTTLSADINMFKTILRNLISNAIKFTNKNGEINIYAEINQNGATITVSDNGVGIREEKLLKIWDFTKAISTSGTANEKGTGFGLLVCKEFVEKHGGKIWVESEVDKGSDFKFTIPLHNA